MNDDPGQPPPAGKTAAALRDEVERLRLAEEELRRLSRKLARSEAQYCAIAESAQDSIFRKDRERRYTYVNPAMARLLGRPAEELVGRTPEELFGPEMGAVIREVDDIALAGEVADEIRTLDLGGAPYTFHTVQTPIWGEAGEVEEIAGIVRDVSDRRRAEERARLHRDDLSWLAETALELSDYPAERDLYRFVANRLRERIGDAIVSVTELDPVRRTLRARSLSGAGRRLDEALHVLGRSDLFELVGTLDPELEAHLAQGGLRRALGVLEVSGGVLPAPLGPVVTRLFGIREVWVMGFKRHGVLLGSVVILLRREAVLPPAQVIETFVGNAALAVERRRAEQTLRESEERFRQLAAVSRDLLFSLDQAGRFVYASPAAQLLLGYEPAALLGEPLGGLLTVESRATLEAALGQVVKGETVTGLNLVARQRENALRKLEVGAFPVVEAGRVVVIHGIARDQTERERLEERVRRMQKLEAIGTLAGGVAHDFNNLLTGILGYADDLKRMSAPGEPVHEAASVIEHAGIRAAEFTRQLLGFARKGKVREEPVDLHEVVQEVIAVLARTVDRRIVISQGLKARRCLVMGDPSQLQQVVLNLGVNARDAMPHGGTLTFETETFSSAGRAEPGENTALPGFPSHLRLRVRDTGEGVSEENHGRIFDPFFTTKPEGQGTGMGLAMTYGIVENHGGTVRLESTSPKGTTFVVELPLVAPEVTPSGPSGQGSLILGEGLVLVVDDEEIVRNLAVRMLERLGYRAVTVRNGAEAVTCYAAHRDEIAVVLLDLVMPQMNGRDCFARLRQIDAEVRVILTTGFGQEQVVQELLTSGVRGYLAKPFNVVDLSQRLAEVLGRP